MTTPNASPTLSVCIPAYNRLGYFREALRSVLDVPAATASRLEVVVSDDSTQGTMEEAWRVELAAANHGQGWKGLSAYHRNTPPLGMAGNWNRCVELARGRYVLILHDDDFLLPHGPAAILRALDHLERPPAVVLFGVELVDALGRPRRRQVVRHRRYLPPPVALARLLSNSSFVRFPGMVVARTAYQSVPPFDEVVGEVADVLMWMRLAANYGMYLGTAITAAYRVHQGALTTAMWREETLRSAARLFDDEAVRRLLRADEIRRLQGRWMSQFVLAGAWRRLRAGDPSGALETLRLFDCPPMAATAVPTLRSAGRRALEASARAQLRSHMAPAGTNRCELSKRAR